MSGKPQTTTVLIARLRRVARYHDRIAQDFDNDPADRARANTCWQCAARLEELLGRLRDPQTKATAKTQREQPSGAGPAQGRNAQAAQDAVASDPRD